MTINISEILSNPSVIKIYDVEPTLDRVKLRRSSYKVAYKEPFTLHVAKNNDKVHITGKTVLDLFIPCDRCLDDVKNHFHIEIDYDVIPNKEPDGIEDDEQSFMDGCILDVDKLITNEIVVALPSKVLCKEDCRGLCTICGTNLNHKECSCDRHVADPRMAAIQDIFKNFNQ
ncbi:MAG: DUF177 domain-containing protein [Eubacteriales bacterium]|nr:DUF177 domain-containing protein [Eubacteriales bacterium]